MNKLETAYAWALETRKRAGDINAWDYEPEKFRLADRTFYTPDFRVVLVDGSVEFHEVKPGTRKKRADGTVYEAPFMEDDAAVKLKVAAEMHPYGFCIAWQRRDKTWAVKGVGNDVA